MKALDRKLLRDLARMWPQLLAAALVMSVGLAALTMAQSTIVSLERARDEYYERYRFASIFAQLKRAPNELAARIEAIPGVRTVQTRIVVDVNLDVPGLAEPAAGRIISIPDDGRITLNALHLRAGRMPDADAAGEVIASEAFVEANGLGPGSRVAAIINGRYQNLTITGVALSPEFIYQIRPGEFLPDDRRFGVFWMPERQLAPAYDMHGAFNDVCLALDPGASMDDVIARLDAVLEPYGTLGALPRSEQTSHRYITDELDQLRGMSIIPPTIFLSAAAFILNIVFARLVRTQREQIAALKAFGYSGRAILAHYLSMVALVALAGSVLGVVVGYRFGLSVTELYTRFFRFPIFEFRLSPAAIATGIGLGVGSAVAGTVRSVLHAAALPPAQAMRPEPPPEYHTTIVERLRLTRLFSPATRMVVRYLERQPVRALLSCLGMSLAGAVLVMGSYTHGALEHLIDYSFSKTQRQDITVAFYEPASPSAAFDLERLPGVVGVEPFRAVPVRFTAGHRSYRGAVTGLPATPHLSRVLDTEERPLSIPDDGLLLSDSLAEILHVGPGDVIEVASLEGERRTFQLRVASVATTYLGTSAYMEINALRTLQREGPVLSGAYMQVDKAQAASLFTLLKSVPRVASVTVKDAALKSFQETMSQNILLMRLFNLIFASVIAFGVVYNSARISLAERAHELATLRVLGMTRAEVSAILLGELGVIALAAIPLGLVLGRVLAGVASLALNTESHRIPLVILPSTYAFAALVVLVATFVSGMVVRRGIDRLDLIEVLKTKG